MPDDTTPPIARLFNTVADGYDHPGLLGLVRTAERLVELAQLSPGQRILDAGAGTGHASLAAARAVGPEGHVTGVEISEGMRVKAQEKIAASGLTNVEIQLGDATRLPFPDNSFDAVLSASVVYTLPDIPAALREWRRVLKPGGLLAFSSLNRAERNALYLELLGKYGPPEMAQLPPQHADTTEKCLRLVAEAGLIENHAHAEQLGYFVPDADHAWAIIWNSAARVALLYLTPPVAEQVEAEYRTRIAETATDQGIWIEWQSLFCLGRKPAE